jgi:hypothetical protein
MWWLDEDGDGAGSGTPVQSCEAPPDHVEAASEEDCDDTDPAVFPGADDPPGDGVDGDCDGRDPAVDVGDQVEADTGRTNDPGAGEEQPKTGCQAIAMSGGLGWLGCLAVWGRRRRAHAVWMGNRTQKSV